VRRALNGDGARALKIEDADLLRPSIFQESEIIALQVGDGVALTISRYNVYHHKAGISLQDRFFLVTGFRLVRLRISGK